MIPCPVGTYEISPVIHRWVTDSKTKLSPVRTTERGNIRGFSRPYGTRICYKISNPSSRTNGLISYVLTDMEYRIFGWNHIKLRERFLRNCILSSVRSVMSIEDNCPLHIKLRRSDTHLASASHMPLLTELKTLFIRRFYRHFTPNGVRISSHNLIELT